MGVEFEGKVDVLEGGAELAGGKLALGKLAVERSPTTKAFKGLALAEELEAKAQQDEGEDEHGSKGSSVTTDGVAQMAENAGTKSAGGEAGLVGGKVALKLGDVGVTAVGIPGECFHGNGGGTRRGFTSRTMVEP